MMSLMIKLGNRRFTLFTLLLLLKGYLAWFVVFGENPTWMTMLTEVPFFWTVFCLIEWFAKKRKLLYYTLANLVLTLLYFTVLMYFKYYGIIVTYHALNQADKVADVGNSTYSLMDPYYLLIFMDIIILLLIPVFMRKKSIEVRKSLKPLSHTALTVAFGISIALCFFNIWPNRASMNETRQAEEMGILNYELYTIFSDTTEDAAWTDIKDIKQSDIDDLKGIQRAANPQYWGADKGKNVIIVQMESFQDFLIGLNVDGVEITPNLNKLAADNFHYRNFYTMVGQGTTSDAEFVVNTSMLVPSHAPATKDYVQKALPSLPKLMSAAGYQTATFHTNDVSFWNRTELYSAIGWDKYYDKSFFGDEDHVAFGASDEVLYAKTIEELKKMDAADKPFYAQVISMSSHHPYNIPEDKVRIDLPEAFDNTIVGRYIKAQNYADYALGQFIDQLKASGLWDDSIVLFYGDHQGLPVYSLDTKQKELMQGLLGHEYGYPDMFNIPLIMHAPDVTYPALIDKTGGQVDILPTVANLMGVSLANQIHFGQDLLNSEANVLPMRHFLPSGSFITDSDVFVPGISYDDGTNFPLGFPKDPSSAATEQQYNQALELLHLSDSYVNQLPDKEVK